MMTHRSTRALISALAVIFVLPQNVLLQMCTPSNTNTFNNTVPKYLPVHVTCVHFNVISNDLNLSNYSFADTSWQNVTYLDIVAGYNSEFGHNTIRFKGSPFRNLHSIKQLVFRGEEIKNLGKNTFDRLKHLDKLQFSECDYLDMDSVIDALQHADITIDTLSLNGVAGFTGQKVRSNNHSVYLLEKMKVRSLSLRYTTFEIDHISSRQSISKYLKTLDMSQTIIFITKHATTIHNLYDEYASFLQGIQTLNISYIPARLFAPDRDFFNNKVILDCDHLYNKLLQYLFLRVENLYSNEIFQDSVIMNNTLLNISNCPFNLKRWHFQANHVQYVNMTVYLPPNNTLMEMDFSNNKIRYASPSFFSTLLSLEILRMNSNELYRMENSSDFNELLVSLTSLKHFSVAKNKLTYIPHEMFRHNLALETLDIEDNELNTLTFQLKHLNRLKHLNIAHNRIKFIDGKALAEIKSIFKLYATPASNHDNGDVIEMGGNPFECSCESVHFMEWITLIDRHLERKYTCLLENTVRQINEESIDSAKYLCHRTAIITSVSATTILLCAGIVLFVVLALRRIKNQKHKCERKLFLHDFQKGLLKEQYLCQVSYSSEDETCFLNTINPNLERAFKQKLTLSREVVCTGDQNFCLGRSIIDEILRCIHVSCVIVFIISKSFCNSRWCDMELKEAYETGKPMILIFKEEVKPDTMSPLLNTIFNRYTRAKLVEAEGQYKLIPDWDNLAESIISLAVEKCRVQQTSV